MDSSWLNLKDKVFIVTGGSSGIGKNIIENLVQVGANVVNGDIQQGDNQPEQLFIKTDVTSKQEVDELVTQTLKKFDKIDGLVNNAGINIPRMLVDVQKGDQIQELNDEIFDKMVAINLKGVYLVAQRVGKEFVKQGYGTIVNMSSESGLEGSEGQSCYAATKAAVNSFTRSWSKELGKCNIRVVGIAPGIMEATGLRTPTYEKDLAYTRGITVEELQSGYLKTSSIPLGRAGQLSEVADFVCYMLSERASYITGVTCNIAGGKQEDREEELNMQIILVRHGELAIAMKESVEMIFGQLPNFAAVTFYPGENVTDIMKKLKTIVEKRQATTYLIIVDLFCGSPYNAAAAPALEDKNLEVLAGMSLPMCLELATLRQATAKQAIEIIKEQSPCYIQSLREQVSIEEEELVDDY